MRSIRRSPVLAVPADFVLAAAVLTALFLPPPEAAEAQTCFAYVNTPAAVPLACVEQGDLTTPCSWDGDCHQDGDPSDCCATVPAAGAQTVREMHHVWHQCFGSIGDTSDGDNPPQRGNRWYAFHRQIEADFNLWRETLTCNPLMGQFLGCKIESLDWCPGMQLPWGFTCGAANPGGCGGVGFVADNNPGGTDCDPAPGSVLPCRPDNAACPGCEAFPQCFHLGGAGPMACPSAPSASCSSGPITLPHTALEDFASVEEITNLLDLSFHGNMHGAVGSAGPCSDINDPECSVRDPMFWRLHKAIDDVVRAWQNVHAADIMLVIDRSGSMNQLDSSGDPKLQVALEAADLFADLLEGAAPAGQTNNVGIVSYASNAANGALNLVPPVAAGPNLRDAGQPFPTTLAAIGGAGGGGCTGIGGGVEAALAAICPGGDCGSLPDPLPAGTNRRKGLLLLTDGVENVPPCLQPAGPAGGTCGGQCFGAELDFTDLYDTQVCAVGFGDTGSLNGDLLTLFAERQGGIYMQSPAAGPDGTWIDLKDFYTKCFGQLTDEFLGLDPKGVLGPDDGATEVIEYTSCGDGKLTFVSGWKEPVGAGELRLLVTAPSGDLVLASEPGVVSSTQPTWDFDRVVLPYRGSSSGTWTAQLVRRHLTFVNGFASDSFRDFEAGVGLVRRQIQRLCPDRCRRVLYFEDVTRGDSAYRKALAIEQDAGLLGRVERARDASELARLLRDDWDLLVYAHQGPAATEPYDDLLARRLCDDLPAIVTDTRGEPAAAILRCAGAQADGTKNHQRLTPEATLAAGELDLIDPGHPVFSYGLVPLGTAAEAHFGRRSAGVVARFEEGEEQRWFVDVLVRGLSRLEPHRPQSKVVTGDDLLPTVRISPMTIVAGGYDSVDARVEIERPLVGLGTLIARAGLREPMRIGEELVGARAATLIALGEGGGKVVPTTTEVYPLYDDGTNGDQVAGNAYWSAQLPSVATADGMYRYRFILDLEKDGCTTRRELAQSVWVEIGVDPQASGVTVEPGPDGRYTVTLTPRDRLGNLWGPGRPVTPSCGPAGSCKCDARGVEDLGQGTYSIAVDVAGNARACTVDAFGTRFRVPLGGAGPSASCLRLRRAIEVADLGSLMRSRLQVLADRACADLSVARGDLAIAEAGAAAGLAEADHELTSHAGELSAADRAELERALAAVVEEHGLAGADAADHDH